MSHAREWVRMYAGVYVCDGIGTIFGSVGNWQFCAAECVRRRSWARELEDAEPWPTLAAAIEAVRAQVQAVDLPLQKPDDVSELNRGDGRFAPPATTNHGKSTEDLHG